MSIQAFIRLLALALKRLNHYLHHLYALICACDVQSSMRAPGNTTDKSKGLSECIQSNLDSKLSAIKSSLLQLKASEQVLQVPRPLLQNPRFLDRPIRHFPSACHLFYLSRQSNTQAIPLDTRSLQICDCSIQKQPVLVKG